jgi:hypothetical protein
MTARILKDFLPLDETLNATTIQNHTLAVASQQTPADDPFTFSVTKPYVLPIDIDEKALATVSSDEQLPRAQRLFDVFAWRVFVALNWPAQQDGQPDTTKDLADRTTWKVWEYWKQTSKVFLPNGSKPAPWGQDGRPDDNALTHWKAAWRQTATPALDQSLQAFSGPLVDQNGNWVHYQAFMNRRMFDYVVANELYNLEGQEKFTSKNIIDFPINNAQEHGVIELKLAWKALTPADDDSRYLVRSIPIKRYTPSSTTVVATNPNEDPEGKGGGPSAQQKTGEAAGNSQETKVGLIGMHIAMRTHSSPQWIWATFEHIDNTRIDESTVPPGHPPIKPSLSDPDNSERLVLANILPPRNASPDPHSGAFRDWDEAKPMDPVEVVRILNPQPATARVNREAQALLRQNNSVLQYYELIGTQWPRDPKLPAMTGGQGSAPESIIRKIPGRVVPVYLANTTMETYFQKGNQDAGPLEDDARTPVSIDTTKVFATESCAGCHFSAGACIGFRKDSQRNYLKGPDGRKIPIFGKNASDGRTGGANFSWALQIESQSTGAGLKP